MSDGIQLARYFESEGHTSNTQISTTTHENFASKEKTDRKYDLELISSVNHAPVQHSTPAPSPDPSSKITLQSHRSLDPNPKSHQNSFLFLRISRMIADFSPQRVRDFSCTRSRLASAAFCSEGARGAT
jgi:hypothetical protein